MSQEKPQSALFALPDLALARVIEMADIITRAKLSATCTRFRAVLHRWHNVVYAREIGAARVLQRSWLRHLCCKARPLLEHEFPGALLRDPYCLHTSALQSAGLVQQSVTAQELNRLHYRGQHYKLDLASTGINPFGRFFCCFRLRKVACWFRECFVALSHCTSAHVAIGQVALFVGDVCVRRWHCRTPYCRSLRIMPNCVLQSLPNRQAHLCVEIKCSAAALANGLLRLRTKTFYVPNNLRWTDVIEQNVVAQKSAHL